MKRRPYLLLTVLGLMASFTLLAVWQERHGQQVRARHASIATTRGRPPAQQDKPPVREADATQGDKTEPPRPLSEIPQDAARQSSALLTDTVLMAATRQGDLQRVNSLLAAGAQVNAVNGSGETALILALEGNRADIMLALLAAGANPNVKTADAAERPFPLLIRTLQTFNRPVYGEITCRTVVRRLLEKGVDVDAVDSDGYTPLLVALIVQEPEIAEWLIQHGADIDRPDKQGKTPLCTAAWGTENRGVMTLLMQRGANIALAHNGGWNVLCWAAEKDDLSTAHKVVRKGLGVNSRDSLQRTPLMYAAANGSMHVLDLLLAAGADVNARDAAGWTALMFAAQTDNVPVAHALLRHGANRRLRDHEKHWTAEERATRVGQERIAELLRTGRIVKRPDSDSERQFVEEERNASTLPTQAQIDIHRWIKAVHLPNIPQDAGEGACGVVVSDDGGKQGEPFGGDTFFFLPEIRVFHDTDGRPYAFLRGHHRTEPNFIVAIRGRTLVQECDFYAGAYEAFCQPLPGGGALVVGFETTYDKMEGKPRKGIPVKHQNDRMASVSQFRHGKLTALDDIFLPQQ